MQGPLRSGMQSLDYEPEHTEKLLGLRPLRTLRINALRGWQGHDSPAGQLVLQRGGELVDVSRGDVHSHALVKHARAMAAHRVTTNLDEKPLHSGGVVLERCEANDLADCAADREWLAIGTLAGHGVEGVGKPDDARGHGQFVHVQAVGIAGAIAAFVMPANDLGNFRPGKLNAADDLMADDGVIGHRAEFVGIERGWLAEQSFVDRDFADVVQISRGTNGGDFGGIDAHSLSNARGVAGDAQRVAVNVDVLYVDGGGEGFEGVVVEAMQRGEELEIF